MVDNIMVNYGAIFNRKYERRFCVGVFSEN